MKATTAGRTPRRSVLIVDDDKFSAQLVCRYLTQEGFRTIAASSAREALSLIASADEPPGLILTDMRMPDMDGSELLVQLHASPKAKKIPVIILSGLDRVEVEPERLGAQGYLKKPLQLDDLSNIVGHYIH